MASSDRWSRASCTTRARRRGVGQRRVRVLAGRLSRHREPELVAPEPAHRDARRVRSHRRHLPSPRPRPVEHDARRERQRRDRDRPADLGRDGDRRARALPQASRRPRGHRGDLHPRARRPLRRRAWRVRVGRTDHRGARLHGSGGGRKRLRRHGDVEARALHVRRRAREGARRTGRYRSRRHQLDGNDRSHRADARDHRNRPGRSGRRRAYPVPDDAGYGVPGRDELLLSRTPRALYGRERHAQLAQPRDAARRGSTRCSHLVAVPERGHRLVRGRFRCRVRVAPLADLGARSHRSLLGATTRLCTRTSTTRPCGS